MTQSDFQNDEHSVTLDRSLRALSCPVRRRILISLKIKNLRDVEEFQSEEFRPADTESTSFKIQLHHVHLPHLDEVGFISWNRESNTVTKGSDFEEIQLLVTCIQNQFDEYFED